MKKILLILLIACSGLVHAQYYAFLRMTHPVTSATSCDGEAELVTNFPVPYKFLIDVCYPGVTFPEANYYSTASNHVTGLCDGQIVNCLIIDNYCRETHLKLTFNAGASIQLNSLELTYPTSGCNGSAILHFEETPTVSYTLSDTSSGTITSPDSVFTGLCADKHEICGPGGQPIGAFYLGNLVISPSVCIPYGINYTASTSSICDGNIVITPTFGVPSDYDISSSTIQNLFGDPVWAYATDFCPGVYRLSATPNFFSSSPASSNYYLLPDQLIYLDTLAPVIWFDSTFIPSGDTFFLPPTFNCDINYSQPIDTIWTAGITTLGTNLYDFEFNLIQAPDTFAFHNVIAIDTSITCYLWITLYCPDSIMRTTSTASHNLLLHKGSITNTLNEIGETKNIVVYPNPAAQALQVKSRNRMSSLEVFSINGCRVFSASPNSDQAIVDLGGWLNGIYMLRYTDEKGRTGVTRFVKL